MVLRSSVEDEVKMRYIGGLRRALHTDRLDCLHVSDIIKECDRYTWYNNRLPVRPSQSLEQEKSLIWGQILHKVVDLIEKDDEKNEFELFYNWADKTIGSDEDRAKLDTYTLKYNFLAGSIDDLIEVDGDWVICDKKTTKSNSLKYLKSDRNSAKKEHILQTSIYAVLLKLCHGIEAKWGCNIYIDNGNGEDERTIDPVIKIYKLNDFDTTYDFIIKRCKEVSEALRSDKLPDKTVNWMCTNVCPHWQKCSANENPNINIENVTTERHELEDK